MRHVIKLKALKGIRGFKGPKGSKGPKDLKGGSSESEEVGVQNSNNNIPYFLI